ETDADLLSQPAPPLLLDLGDDTRTNGAAALGACEPRPLVHRDRLAELDVLVRVVARHDHLLAVRELDRAGHVRRPEVELRPGAVGERRGGGALFLADTVHRVRVM